MIQPSTVIRIWTPSNQDGCVSVRVRACVRAHILQRPQEESKAWKMGCWKKEA